MVSVGAGRVRWWLGSRGDSRKRVDSHDGSAGADAAGAHRHRVRAALALQIPLRT